MAAGARDFAEGEPCRTAAMLPDVEAGERLYGQPPGWTFAEPVAEPFADPVADPVAERDAAVFGYGTYKADFGEGGEGGEAEGEDVTVWTAPGTAGGPDTPGDAASFCGSGLLGTRRPPEMPPRFLPYLSVTDCDGAVAAAPGLGGRVDRVSDQQERGMPDSSRTEVLCRRTKTLTSCPRVRNRGLRQEESASGPPGPARQ